MVFPTFFNLSLNFEIRSSWSEPQSAPVLFLLAVWSFSIFGCKECNHLTQCRPSGGIRVQRHLMQQSTACGKLVSSLVGGHHQTHYSIAKWWPKDWRTIIPKKFPHCWESSRTHNRFPNLRIKRRGWEPRGIWLWSSVGFDYRTSIGLGKQKLLEVTNKTLCTPGLRKKEQWPHKRLSQTCLWVFGSLWQRCGSTAACFGVRDIDCLGPVRTSISPFRWGCHYPYHTLASSQTAGRDHRPIHQQKSGLKIYWAWPCPPEYDPVFPTASLSHHKPLILIYQRAERMKTTITEN